MQISGLPSTTTLNSSTVFAVENSNVTYKMDYATLCGTDGPIKVASQLVSFPSGVGNVTITAPTVSGYTFVCWLGAYCTSGANSYTIVNGSNTGPTSASATMFIPSSLVSSNVSYVVLALYAYKK